MFEVSLDLSGYMPLVEKTIRTIGHGTHDAVAKGVERGAEYARNNHPFQTRTGELTSKQNLRGFIVKGDSSGADGIIQNTTPYAAFVEWPTKPHQIRPKEGFGLIGPLQAGQSRRAKNDVGTHRVALRFMIGGRTVFAAYVNHPGTPGFPFMAPAGEFAAWVVAGEIQNVVFPAAVAIWV
jgi:hypothetical protein